MDTLVKRENPPNGDAKMAVDPRFPRGKRHAKTAAAEAVKSGFSGPPPIHETSAENGRSRPPTIDVGAVNTLFTTTIRGACKRHAKPRPPSAGG